jgi:hypothetical protein
MFSSFIKVRHSFKKFEYGLGLVREMDALRGEAQEYVQVRTSPLNGISISPRLAPLESGSGIRYDKISFFR